MQKKLLAIIVALIIIVAAFAAWQLTLNSPSAARSIRIGLVAPLNTPVGQDMSKAAQMAVSEINDAGGIFVAEWNTKVKITIINADTVDDNPANAATPVAHAIETNQVDLLIGGYASSGTLASEIPAIDNKVPFIISGATNRLVTRRGPQGDYGGFGPNGNYSISDAEGMSYVFHYSTTTYHYSKTVVDFFATEMKPMVAADRNFRLAILYRNDALGIGVEQATKYWIENETLPIDLVADRSYDPTITDYKTDLAAVAASNPDAVFVVDNPDKTPLVIKQGWNDVGLKTVYIAVENNQAPVFFSLLGETGNGQLLESNIDPFMIPSYLPALQTYSQKFNETYGVLPGLDGTKVYDSFYVAKDAIERAGTVDKTAVRTAIEKTNMNQMRIMTQTGKIQFSTAVNYHEIDPITFIEQLYWDTTSSQLKSQIVWPASAPGVSNLKQADFTLPTGYQAGHS